MGLMARIENIVEEVRREHAADPRHTVYEVDISEDGVVLVIDAVTSEPTAAEALESRLGTLEAADLQVVINRLPGEDTTPGHVLVTSAIAPMLAYPVVSATHVSQALLGHRLMVLRVEGRWLQCRSQDGYLGWIHRGYVLPVDEVAARAWEIGTPGEVCISLGAVLDGDDGVVARLPWGARLVREASGEVRLPGGLRGNVRGELLALTEQTSRFPLRGPALVDTASRWIGSPYLWGGTTPSGVDCSGLVQAIYRTHGLEIPRDSDQQADSGTPVDPGEAFGELLPGDLLFFEEAPGRITHVALSTGAGGIIHSSLGNGGVWLNDVAGELDYERELRSLFACARRYA